MQPWSTTTYSPATQPSVHGVAASTSVEYLPDAHGVHAVRAASSEYVPAAHATQPEFEIV